MTKGGSGTGDGNDRKNKPWQDSAGRKLSTEQLRIVSQDWSRETWDEYLESLEVQPDAFVVDCYEKALEVYPGEPAEETPATDFADTAILKNRLMSLLPLERAVITSIYWEGLSERETADQLRITRWSTGKIHQGALKKLREEVSPLPPGNVVALPRPRRFGAAVPLTQGFYREAVNEIVH